MTNSKTVTIAGREITIRELRVIDIMHAPDEINATTPEGIPYLMLRCLDISAADIADFSFSELEQLEKEFMEVNAAFFRRAGSLANLPA